jgi:para-aminobenzoate synthetase component 2
MILIVDNYDSFVHNVARYFEELGERTLIRRNDEVAEGDLKAKAIVISPGPCAPRQAGQSMDIVRQCSGHIPILGICLGHQVIGEVFGDVVTRARKPMHGDSSDISHDGSGVFEGLPQRFSAGRYHSLIVETRDASPLIVTAHSEEGEVMGLRHREHPTFGVQFHPESILTEHGYDMLRNFLRVTQ